MQTEVLFLNVRIIHMSTKIELYIWVQKIPRGIPILKKKVDFKSMIYAKLISIYLQLLSSENLENCYLQVKARFIFKELLHFTV